MFYLRKLVHIWQIRLLKTIFATLDEQCGGDRRNRSLHPPAVQDQPPVEGEPGEISKLERQNLSERPH